jgi:hypothetical protein
MRVIVYSLRDQGQPGTCMSSCTHYVIKVSPAHACHRVEAAALPFASKMAMIVLQQCSWTGLHACKCVRA